MPHTIHILIQIHTPAGRHCSGSTLISWTCFARMRRGSWRRFSMACCGIHRSWIVQHLYMMYICMYALHGCISFVGDTFRWLVVALTGLEQCSACTWYMTSKFCKLWGVFLLKFMCTYVCVQGKGKNMYLTTYVVLLDIVLVIDFKTNTSRSITYTDFVSAHDLPWAWTCISSCDMPGVKNTYICIHIHMHTYHDTQSVENGCLRVNYYIKELYGDPTKERDAWKQPLAVMTLEGRYDLNTHSAYACVCVYVYKQPYGDRTKDEIVLLLV